MKFLFGFPAYSQRRIVRFFWIWAFWNKFAGICWASFFLKLNEQNMRNAILPREWMQILQEDYRRCTKRHQLFDMHWNSSELRWTKTTVFKVKIYLRHLRGFRGGSSMAGSQSQINQKHHQLGINTIVGNIRKLLTCAQQLLAILLALKVAG